MPQRGVVLQKGHPEQDRISRGLAVNRKSVLRCGRRFGKTTLLENCAATWAYDGLKVGWFAPSFKLILPSYKRILRTLTPIVVSKSKVDMLIETSRRKNGLAGLVEFWTLNDEDAGRSRSYDWIIIDEGSLVAKGLQDTWEQAMSPTLLDRGGKAVMAGTPKGIDPDNFFYEACTKPKLGWTEFFAPTASNPMLDPAEVADLVNQYPPLVYQQEFLAEFVDWSGAAFFSRESMLDDGKPLDWPARCDGVFATIDTAVKTGSGNDGTAVIYWAANENYGVPLTVLDWDIVQIEGALLETWMPTVFQRLEDMALVCGARTGSAGAWIEDKSTGMVLLQQAARRGWPAQPIDSKLTSVGKDERAISVSGYVYQGKVKLSTPAFDKISNYKGQVRNHFLTQVCGFRVGVKDQADDLLDCFTYGIAMALGNYAGF